MPSPQQQDLFFENDSQDELYRLLLQKQDSDVELSNVTDQETTRAYLASLTSKSLSDVLREPAQLREEQARVTREAQQLAFREYTSFLHAHECRRQLNETLGGMEGHLDEFLSTTTQIEEACELFSTDAQLILKEHDKISKLLEHHNILTDLFEIPQLMETCVWNGYYAEAMDLASHVRLLYVRYPMPTIKSIEEQVQSSSDLMLIQLISHLRKPIRLAAAMNVIGYLRRMDIFQSEDEIRMVFLRCRDDHLQQRLARTRREISDNPRQRSTDTFEYLKRFIDVMREQVFEIGTQYVFIFSNDQGTLLADYMVYIVEYLKSVLEAHLPMIDDTSALNSLLTQLQYCGMSLGRIGLDFRHIFVNSFEEVVKPMIMKYITDATDEFVNTISRATEESAAPNSWMCSRTISTTAELPQREAQSEETKPRNTKENEKLEDEELGKDRVEVEKLDDEKAKENKAEEDKAEEDKAEEDKAEDEKADDEKVKEDNAEEDKAEEDKAEKTKVDKDEAKEDKEKEKPTAAKKQSFQPPMLLVNYPPLAIFTNNILSAYNALRLLPAISLYEPIQSHLEESFQKISVALQQYCDHAASDIPNGSTILQSFTDAYNDCCLPYLRSCLIDGIYHDFAFIP